MRYLLTLIFVVAVSSANAQPPGKFPPDSLINVKVIPRTTPVQDVIGIMRGFTSALGVRCQFCHEGKEGQPLAQFDFASDNKRNKLVARQMMRMVQEINRRLDTLPERPQPLFVAECSMCHRGVNRPVPLFSIVQQAAVTAGADSAVRAYKALRARYYGRDAYDFSESALNTAAFRTARAGKPDEALALLKYNEELYPNSSGMSVFKGNILLMKGDTTAAVLAFREAVQRDSTNNEARNRLQTFDKKR